MKEKHLQKTFIYCLFIFVISLTITVVKYNILPPKYFYDSNKIVNIMNGVGLTDPSFTFTANFYKMINILNIHEIHLYLNNKTIIITEMLQWGLILSFLGTTFLFGMLIKRKEYSTIEYIFLYVSVVLLNIYVFNISKDFIQFLFLLAIYIILIQDKWNNFLKITLIGFVLAYEAFNFRIYYGIMAVLIITFYILYSMFFKNKEKNNKTLVRFIILSITTFLLGVFCISLLFPSSFDEIMYARSSVNALRDGSVDATTIITEPLGDNTNIFVFSGNYIINFMRMIFPIELIVKGIKYMVFVIYQLFITYNLFKLWKSMHKDSKKILLFMIIFSYEMMSVIFEPDFGSFVKHQSAMTLLFLEMLISNHLTFNISKWITNKKN